MGSLFQELKRRKVFRVAVAYAIVAWVLIQISGEVLPALQMPEWTVSFVTVLLLLGFPVALLLAWAFELTPDGVKADTGIQQQQTIIQSTDRKLIFLILGLVIMGMGFQISDRFLSDNARAINRSPGSASAIPTVMQSSINLDQSLQPVPGLGVRTFLSLAPSGAALAYTNFEAQTILLRNLATRETQRIVTSAGTAIFSPDSQKLLVLSLTDFGLGVMLAQGGGLRPLPIENIPPRAFWLTDEEILYRHIDGGLRIYSLVDETDELVPNFDSAGENNPVAGLPGGDAFFFTKNNLLRGQNQTEIQIYDLNSLSETLVTNDGYYPQYVRSGHVLFLRAGDLWAVPFDLDALRAIGPEARILEGVDSQPIQGQAAYSVSDFGRLVYLPGREYVPDQEFLVWSDRLGNRTELRLRAGNYDEPRLSPNGELLALASFQPDGSSDIWIHDFSSGSFNPITFSGNARSPVWTPDGSQLVYLLDTSINTPNRPRGELWIMNTNGTGQAERLIDGGAKADSFSPIDGKLIYMFGGPASGTPINLSTLTYSDDAWIADSLLHTESYTWGARVSPDGRWIAYGSNESGIMQIYVQPYPNLEGGKWQISSDPIGDREPSWGPNGDELFFLRLDGSLMHAEITIEGDSFSSGAPQPLITGLSISRSSPGYLVSNDGERFLHFSSEYDESDTGLDQDHTELIVVENFFEELERLAPPDPQ